MLDRLPTEILCMIAEQTRCPSTLWALCCVSNRLNAICTPFLYRNVFVHDFTGAALDRLSALPSKTHLWHIERFNLHLQQMMDLMHEDQAKPLVQALSAALQKMPRLRSINIYGLLFGCLGNPDSENNGMTLSKVLVELECLEEVVLWHELNYEPTIRAWPIPSFHNLKSLALHCLDGRGRGYCYVSELIELLLASPGLKALGLSHGIADDQFYFNLETITSEYADERRRRGGQSPLQLESLHLGMGVLPWEGIFDGHDSTDYLEELTELQYLTSLRLDNQWEVTDEEEVDAQLFRRAVNLKSITVQRFSPDIVRLIGMLQETQPDDNLEELEVLNYFPTFLPEDQWEAVPPGWYPPIYSVPLEHAGNVWKKLSYAGEKIDADYYQDTAENALRNFVAACDDVEELAVPIHNHHEMTIFKEEVLPNLHNLHTLHVHGEYTQLVSRIATSRHALSGLTEEDVAYHSAVNRSLEQEDEKRKINLARLIFEWHQELRDENPDMALLRCVGVAGSAYCREFRFQPETTDEVEQQEATEASSLHMLGDGSMVVRLPPSEARNIGLVNYFHSNWMF